MPVLDASVLVAFLSPSEAHHKQAVTLYRSVDAAVPFIVPSVFPIEVLSAFAMRGVQESYLKGVQGMVWGPKFRRVELDDKLLHQAAKVVEQCRTRAYDSLYVATALLANEPLLTLDREVIDRVRDIFPKIIPR
jgi:predicted nucleic acid-binding protein